jgi:hypothetical protein
MVESRPKGRLACPGEAISKADHPDLFAAIGDRFGPTATG